jgi:hypothetical protein
MKKDTVITFRSYKSDLDNLKNVAQNHGISKSECCRLAVFELFKKHPNGKGLAQAYHNLLNYDRTFAENEYWRIPDQQPEEDMFE